MHAPESETPNSRMSDETAAFPDWILAVDRQHRPGLLRYAFSLCRNYPQAEDAVQETFLRLCREPRERIEDRLEPWLLRVCRSRIIDVHRKEGRMSSLDEALTAVVPDDRSANPADEAESHDTHRRILLYIDRLPPAQREVVRLKFQNHLSYQEIAEVTHKTVNTVGVLLHTAMTSLRRVLAEDAELGPGKGESHEE